MANGQTPPRKTVIVGIIPNFNSQRARSRRSGSPDPLPCLKPLFPQWTQYVPAGPHSANTTPGGSETRWCEVPETRNSRLQPLQSSDVMQLFAGCSLDLAFTLLIFLTWVLRYAATYLTYPASSFTCNNNSPQQPVKTASDLNKGEWPPPLDAAWDKASRIPGQTLDPTRSSPESW